MEDRNGLYELLQEVWELEDIGESNYQELTEIHSIIKTLEDEFSSKHNYEGNPEDFEIVTEFNSADGKYKYKNKVYTRRGHNYFRIELIIDGVLKELWGQVETW